MKSLFRKLLPTDIKTLSTEINKTQEKFFGNSLSLRKQEDFMAALFQVKNWSTLLGMLEKEPLSTKMIQSSSYEECIRLLCKCDTFIEEPSAYLDETYFENSDISSYFWDKGFDEAMKLANYFENEQDKLQAEVNDLKRQLEKKS